MNEALKNILERNSHRQLDLPVPSIEEMKKVYQAALRAPDHAWLRPSSFIEIQGKGLDKLSKAFVDFAEENITNLLPEKLEKYKNSENRDDQQTFLFMERAYNSQKKIERLGWVF